MKRILIFLSRLFSDDFDSPETLNCPTCGTYCRGEGGIFCIDKPFYVAAKRKEKVLKACGCVCYCPACNDILNDQAECTDTDLVRYKCSCGRTSEWNFDIAPVPILFKNDAPACSQ